MKKIFKIIFVVIVFTINIQIVHASIINNTEMQLQAEKFRSPSGLVVASSDASLAGIVAVVINAFLGVLAIIFIIILIMAGYKYMTAGGNEDKTKEAIDSIRRAVIGLIIIVSAYAITYFVFNSMTWFGGGSSSGSFTM